MTDNIKIPKPAKHLSREARGIWRSVLTAYDLETEGRLILEGALESFDRMRQALAAIEEHGILMGGGATMARLNPAVRAENDSKKVMLSYLKQLGLDLEPIGRIGRPLPQGVK